MPCWADALAATTACAKDFCAGASCATLSWPRAFGFVRRSLRAGPRKFAPTLHVVLSKCWLLNAALLLAAHCTQAMLRMHPARSTLVRGLEAVLCLLLMPLNTYFHCDVASAVLDMVPGTSANSPGSIDAVFGLVSKKAYIILVGASLGLQSIVLPRVVFGLGSIISSWWIPWTGCPHLATWVPLANRLVALSSHGLEFLLTAWWYAFSCCHPLMQQKHPDRSASGIFRMFHSRWAYHLGFGVPCAATTLYLGSLLNPLVPDIASQAFASILYPQFFCAAAANRLPSSPGEYPMLRFLRAAVLCAGAVVQRIFEACALGRSFSNGN